MNFRIVLIISLCAVCNNVFGQQKSKFKKVPWAYNSVMYEVNTRQFSTSGKFSEVTKQLPRIKELGATILWFMPIHPISVEGRKGSLGSYYAIKDYKAINPEFGNMDDFKTLVNEAHKLGLKVMMDVVFNHTGNDHEWVKTKPDFYNYDKDGKIVHPNGWEDVSELNDNNKKLWKELNSVLEFWVKQADVDGYRCDVADMLPLEFWLQARQKVEKTKKLFWLAECDKPEYHAAFDATYAWEWLHTTEDISKGKKTFLSLDSLYEKYRTSFPKDAIKLYFTSNHDENSWSGTEFERYGEMALKFAALSLMYNGMPLIYNGQEASFDRRLAFFEKDSINWDKLGKNFKTEELYKRFANFKQTYPAMQATDQNVTTTKLKTHDDENIYAFKRNVGQYEMVVAIGFNQSKGTGKVFKDESLKGQYVELMTGKIYKNGLNELNLLPGKICVFYK